MSKIRVAVVGAGQFGKRHMRVVAQSEKAALTAVVDVDPRRAAEAAEMYSCEAAADVAALEGRVDAAVVAVPTTAHSEVGCALLEAGVDILVEKPIAPDLTSARRLVETAEKTGRILQVGHLERFNPAVAALRWFVTLPLFFEIHRLSPFTPRSLDVDVVLDLMIHDIDIVLSLVGAMPEEVRAAGISVLTEKVDIANVRLAFPGGCIANLTASRVSTERVRKLRLFQPSEYFSLDYLRQEVVSMGVTAALGISSKVIEVRREEPLRLELESFFDCVRRRAKPVVDGREASMALEVALEIAARIREHLGIVARTVAALGK